MLVALLFRRKTRADQRIDDQNTIENGGLDKNVLLLGELEISTVFPSSSLVVSLTPYISGARRSGSLEGRGVTERQNFPCA